jgi:hypothetical protein
MNKKTVLLLLGILVISAGSFYQVGLAADKTFVEKSFGNQRYLYAVPHEKRGPFTYSQYPLAMQRTFNAPPDRVLNAVHRLAASKNATTLVNDQPSGLVVFKHDFTMTSTAKDPILGVFDRKVEGPRLQVYFNVLLKQGDTLKNTIVYATYFIPRLSMPQGYLDVEFFQTLERNL